MKQKLLALFFVGFCLSSMLLAKQHGYGYGETMTC